jgi:hypothetical protein
MPAFKISRKVSVAVHFLQGFVWRSSFSSTCSHLRFKLLLFPPEIFAIDFLCLRALVVRTSSSEDSRSLIDLFFWWTVYVGCGADPWLDSWQGTKVMCFILLGPFCWSGRAGCNLTVAGVLSVVAAAAVSLEKLRGEWLWDKISGQYSISCSTWNSLVILWRPRIS